jgi:hypothetical protein
MSGDQEMVIPQQLDTYLEVRLYKFVVIFLRKILQGSSN